VFSEIGGKEEATQKDQLGNLATHLLKGHSTIKREDDIGGARKRKGGTLHIAEEFPSVKKGPCHSMTTTWVV